jgi:hypothetical protein
VKVANIPGKKVEHQGIKVQLLGQIELASERGHPHTFISLGKRTFPVLLCAYAQPMTGALLMSCSSRRTTLLSFAGFAG